MKTNDRNLLLAALLIFGGLLLSAPPAPAADPSAELRNIAVSGGVEDGKARLIIEGWLGSTTAKSKGIFATTLQHLLHASTTNLSHQISATFDVLDGNPEEFALTLAGEGQLRRVNGADLRDWSVRQETNGTRTLILRPLKAEKPLTQLSVTILADQEIGNLPAQLAPLSLAPVHPALLGGFLKITTDPQLSPQVEKPSGLIPIDPGLLPEPMRGQARAEDPQPLAFRFQGVTCSLPLKLAPADPEARRVVLINSRLAGQLGAQTASFTLSAIARVRDPKGGSLTLLSGGAALTRFEPGRGWRVRHQPEGFQVIFDKPGEYPVEIHFDAAVRQGLEGSKGWNRVDFKVAPAVLQQIVLRGLDPKTQFEFADAGRPERAGNEFVSYLPPDGAVKLSWKESPPESEGKLFFAAEMLAQVTVSPGLMRQVAMAQFKVMQGELNQVSFILRGEGEVTRVQGEHVLAWKVESLSAAEKTRRLLIQFNQAEKDQFGLLVQMQTPLGAFPQVADALQLRPEGATRFSGYFRIVNEGAVRLEVAQARGMSQISPEQFPETETTKAILRPAGSQRFAYRFSSGDFALRIQADQITPELTVSEILAYHHGETELGIDAEIELDIREAPLRDLFLRVPRGFAVARLNVAGLSDYFLREPEGQAEAELRLVYGQPVSGRQAVQLRLERNSALGAATWTLPRVEVAGAKSTRGHVGVSADAGFRLTPDRTQALTEMATAFFPRKTPGLQSAFRLSDPAWQATIRVERLPQTIQADALHLFSIGEGIAYGSSVLNYLVSGAPVSTLRLELSNEYFNVEFTGKDIRNWQKSEGGYVVQLHTPVSGTYTLLATYERPFRAQGDTLTFTGARPLDVQSEQGYTLVTSAYQFQVNPAEVSPGLLALETGEVPAEYRLLFDAPILAAYRYTSRPFNLRLALSPLTQGDSLSQVVDRASLTTRVSKEGQVLTDVRYFMKNRGNPNLRLSLPEGTQLWSAAINGKAVVPVTDGKANLIPLPQGGDPNALLTVDLKLASRSSHPGRVAVGAPIVNAPVMLAEWKLEPDTGQRLVYRSGTLKPAGSAPDNSGFAQLARMFSGRESDRAWIALATGLALLVLALLVWRTALQPGVYRLGGRHISATLVGAAAFVLAILAFGSLIALADHQTTRLPRGLTFLAPVQQAGSLSTVQVSNLADRWSFWRLAGSAWPALLAVAVWIYGWLNRDNLPFSLGKIAGWMLLVWAALRTPNGAPAFLAALIVFMILHAAVPALRSLWQLPPRPAPAPTTPAQTGGAPAITTLLIAACFWMTLTGAFAAEKAAATPRAEPLAKSPEVPMAESVSQTIRVEDKFAFASAKVRWQAIQGQVLPVLHDPAVLTKVSVSGEGLRLVQLGGEARETRGFLAERSGDYSIDLQYQMRIARSDTESRLALPIRAGLINQLELTLAGLDVDVSSPQAVSIDRQSTSSNTVARLVLSPAKEGWVAWKPRSRDVRHEKPVFYADISQLLVPTAGVLEGAHHVTIRPAQGQLGELLLTVPSGTTISDVFDAPQAGGAAANNREQQQAAAPALVSSWRFDPDTRKVRVAFAAPQSRPFTVIVRSQAPTGPLPFQQTFGLLSVDHAGGQIGLLGIASGSEVQLDTVDVENVSPINLEDFPAQVLTTLQPHIAGLALRRAYRYADANGRSSLRASPVEPDVRVETQDTLSLGEDRAVLAVNANVTITRAGIFRLSFVMPSGFDVDSISGPALSHWTESRTNTSRITTLHLRGKTEGQQQFTISLAGPGVRATNGWAVPQLVLREANKQRGSLLLVPEQGMRLQVRTRDGLTQLDPQKSGIQQKGVLAFRILQVPWNLAVDIEQVDAWIQLTSLQHATVNEALMKVTANLQYQIENTGLKAFRVFVPTNAENVRFSGDQVADFLPATGDNTNGLRAWEVKLHRRVIGSHLLKAAYQIRMPEQASSLDLRGIQAGGVNLQRGFVTVESGGRLQLRVEQTPTALQPTEWQSIPRALQQDLQAASVSLAYRLVEPSFSLRLALQRHEAARLLPARVNSVTLASVISDDGVMLTQARLDLVPGDKRLLHLSLPADAHFWFAFVNDNGVWPWRDQNRILVPLEQQSRVDKPTPVEIFYTCKVGAAGRRSLDLNLLAPKFDLPLENVTWRVSLSEKWRMKRWSGSLQFQEEQVVPRAIAADLQLYLQNQNQAQQQRTREAEQLLAFGNSALEQGDPQQARRAFQAAFGLSTHDAAFNEDARVQLHNIKLQQALVGLNVRQAAAAGEGAKLAGKLREQGGRKELNYTQQDAKGIIEGNRAEDNAAFMRLAEKLIQQQDAAVSSPAVIRATIPEQGQVLTFKRAVVVDPWADLKVSLTATTADTASKGLRLLVLLATLAVLALLARAARRPTTRAIP